ncbi:hypothetical protein ISE1_2131 [plant metagenome]|uniref:Uncharacterized protein n=1 Tax=plant metagenome TaxID=1297885 RepID=A0A484TEB1_9ZZZZ
MNSQDKAAIDSVFDRLKSVQAQGGARDTEAEAEIQARMDAQPGAAYYLAQTVVIQEQALKTAQARIADLETGKGAASGATGASGLGRQFSSDRPVPGGNAAVPPAQAPAANQGLSANAGFGRSAGGGGGFMAGAMQTALGVAGGLMLGNFLGGLLGGNDAQAATPEADAGAQDAQDAAPPAEEGWDDGGGDFGGDMGGFDDI